MSRNNKINEIVDFVTRHPQTVASRRICREVLGRALERFNEEFAAELDSELRGEDESTIESYYTMIR